ncbi:MAG TPA: nuclear transport factor 2 family protein [Vicinamibacteria bacterium]|nr:nuclear transport factor 2 family protein [Vicinamibacteria bacterium]
MLVNMLSTLLLLMAVQSSDDKAELVRLEEVWNIAHLEGDASTLERLWADEFTVTVPRMPVMPRAEAVGVARSNRIKFSKYETSEVAVEIFGNAAVVRGRMRRSRSRGDQSIEDEWRFTKVYVKREGTWKVVAFHASESPSGS